MKESQKNQFDFHGWHVWSRRSQLGRGVSTSVKLIMLPSSDKYIAWTVQPLTSPFYMELCVFGFVCVCVKEKKNWSDG